MLLTRKKLDNLNQWGNYFVSVKFLDPRKSIITKVRVHFSAF